MTDHATRLVIALGADHAGFPLKEALVKHARAKGLDVIDLGTDSTEPVDYPDLAARVAEAVASGRASRGVLVCGSAIGMCIAANRYRKIRAAALRDEFDARMSREHNDANVACFGARVTPEQESKRLLDLWLATAFAGGRHARRVGKIDGEEKMPR
ncbi:MAG: ribose 5-phosphate isomerase B [Deltaproteobacteria bacterium]|nr:ribose 5-phosphate isomerase B [Deltaproteobacteria bacterium]